MTTGIRFPEPSGPLQRASHILFVEGRQDSPADPTESSRPPFDQAVLGAFLDDILRVEPLGPSFHLRSAAEALHPFHPTYYFLIDRDHHDDTFVARTWDRFPDPTTHNLLVWPRRELENYFIDPAYLLRSPHLDVDEATLRTYIQGNCQQRLYLDVANQVITELRESLKANWLKSFDKPAELATRDTALAALRDHPAFPAKRTSFATDTQPDALQARFLAVLTDYTGGREPLEFGAGRWLERLRGKEVWPIVANRCFRITDARGTALQGALKRTELAKALVRLTLSEQPADFQQLHRILAARVRPVAA